ncbi:protein kinase domain-containing protein [Legionella saoudiensis]|uniref:protein kinase domain-containing protein n=1 Tax=Legionella saoudiensis TaxID=1750561 RepID=UPI000731D73B|nr:hypothetical protein [Legionella saoudiensis]
MLTPIKSSGSLFSSKRLQIDKLNEFIRKINKHHESDPQKALGYVKELNDFYQKRLQKDDLTPTVAIWFIENPIESIHNKIQQQASNNQLRNKILDLTAQIQLPTIYESYTGKDSFRTLVEGELSKVNKGYKVTAIHSNNNPIVQINHEDDSFVVRFLRMNKNDEDSGVSPRLIREQIQDLPQIPQPYLLEFVAEDHHEITYLEYSEFYASGNLQQHFEALRNRKDLKYITTADIDKELVGYAKKLVEFLIAINEKQIWYTDLKPGNILLNDEQDIIISDIKGLISSSELEVPINRTSTSQAYFQSSVFNKNQINLKMLQCQTLATTLYELACGEPPTQLQTSNDGWRNIYNFKQPVFRSEQGKELRQLINNLLSKEPPSMEEVLEFINKHELNTNVSLEDTITSDKENTLDSVSLIELSAAEESSSYVPKM